MISEHQTTRRETENAISVCALPKQLNARTKQVRLVLAD